MSDFKTSILVNRQVPEFVRDEHPIFVSFLEAYYEFLENKQGIKTNDLITKTKELRYVSDVDSSIDDFETNFFNTYAALIPKDTQVDKALLIKNLLPLYLAKGSEKSFKLLFRLLYGEEIEVIKPKNSILRASDGKWLVEKTFRISQDVYSTYTGDGTTSKAISGLNFQPDFVWAKSRSSSYYHGLFDSVRGGIALYSNATSAEDSTEKLTFNSNGFTTPNVSNDFINYPSVTYVAWNWKAASSNTTNSSGSVTAIARVNQTAGFSVSVFTTPTSGTYTVGHSLSSTPNLVIFKSRGSGNWIVQHSSTGTQYTLLNSVAAAASDSTVWNSAATSSVVNFGTGFSGYSGASAVMYCWTAVPNYSAFGSYTGNGSSDGPFIYTGFRPKFIIVKCSSSTDGGNAEWLMYDSSRDSYNVMNTRLWADSSAAEYFLTRISKVTVDVPIDPSFVVY